MSGSDEDNNNFQRVGSLSNAQVGRDFERLTQKVLNAKGLDLDLNCKVKVGVRMLKKDHAFDLGSTAEGHQVIVECKSHKWTKGDNVPSAKITVWNEAMYYFAVAPHHYRKIFFVLKDKRASSGETLARYYIRLYAHLIPSDVEIWEYDGVAQEAIILATSNHQPEGAQ